MANRIADPAIYTTKTTLGGGELIHSNDANQDRLFSVDTLSTYAGNKAIPSGYIEGLTVTWVSGTALTVTSGSAYIPSLSRVLRSTSDIAKTGLTLSASTMYHVYLYLNGTTPDIEIVTTVPSSAYTGTARTKNADNSRRYVGSIRTTTSGAIAKFSLEGSFYKYQDVTSNYGGVVLNAMMATTPTSVSCSAVVPPTSKTAIITMANFDTSAIAVLANQDCNFTLSSSNWLIALNPSSRLGGSVIGLSSNQAFNYMYLSSPTNGLLGIVTGYTFER